MDTADRARIEEALESLRAAAPAPEIGIRRAAVSLLLRGATFESSDVLLMKRAERESDRWSGHIGLPGGHEEEFDDDLVATARRESVEEVGVDPGGNGSTLLGAMPEVRAKSRGEVLSLSITPYVFHRLEPEIPVLGPEAAEAFWLPLERAANGEFESKHRYEHEGLVHRLPAWTFEGHTIWGMTYGILSRFHEAVSRTRG